MNSRERKDGEADPECRPDADGLLQWGGRAILYNPDRVTTVSLEWFDPRFWTIRGLVRRRFQGRGETLAVETPAGPAVLRPFRRGGWVARVVSDRYFFLGLARSRAFREFEMLKQLHRAGLPVPTPLAALCERSGLSYRAALLTTEIRGAQTLAEIAIGLSAQDWARLRDMLDAFFKAGLRHPDLNARNVLRDGEGRWFLIDFDRARIAQKPSRPAPMIKRLQRSLNRLGLAAAADSLQGI